jgi:hypothetical protein
MPMLILRRLATVFFVVLGLGGAALAQGKPDDPFAAKLPQGEGRELVLELCSGACHLSDKFVDARRSAAQWHETVLQMVQRGAQLFPDDVEALTKYFATYLGSDAPGKPENSRFEPHDDRSVNKNVQ